MAIRIRKVDGHVVALCAAETQPELGDLYLDDAVHHALDGKFHADYVKMGFIKKEGLPEKRALTVDEIISKYPMTVRILLVQLVEQIERLEKKKPKVTEEFVKEYAEMINTDPHHCTRENLIGMLTEAGVEVKEKK